MLGRDLSRVIIVDNKATHFKKHPENGIVVTPWTGDLEDRELCDLIAVFQGFFKKTHTTHLFFISGKQKG